MADDSPQVSRERGISASAELVHCAQVPSYIGFGGGSGIVAMRDIVALLNEFLEWRPQLCACRWFSSDDRKHVGDPPFAVEAIEPVREGCLQPCTDLDDPAPCLGASRGTCHFLQVFARRGFS